MADIIDSGHRLMTKIVVKEISDPFEGQQAYSQDGRLVVYHMGHWITFEEYQRGVYIRLFEAGSDCE